MRQAYAAMSAAGAMLALWWFGVLLPRALLVEEPLAETERRMDELAEAIREYRRTEGRSPMLIPARLLGARAASVEQRRRLMSQRFRVLGSHQASPTDEWAEQPLDPFSPGRSLPFSVEHIGDYWIIQSPGPDGDYDIKSLNALILYGIHDEARRGRGRGRRAQPVSQPLPQGFFDFESTLAPHTYDPTKGAFSSGDLFRVGRFEEMAPRRQTPDAPRDETGDPTAAPADRIGA